MPGCTAHPLHADLLVAAMGTSGSNKFLIDGYPRKLDQLEAFEAKASERASERPCIDAHDAIYFQ